MKFKEAKAGIDRLFDSGLITFEDDGLIRISDQLKGTDRDALGLSIDFRLSEVHTNSLPYLDPHRKSIFLL